MPSLFWDASGLAKYYTEEAGNDTAEALFQFLPPQKMVTTPWGYAETFALLQRKCNDKRISSKLFADAVSRLRTDMIDSPQFHLLTVTNADIIGSIIHDLSPMSRRFWRYFSEHDSQSPQ